MKNLDKKIKVCKLGKKQTLLLQGDLFNLLENSLKYKDLPEVKKLYLALGNFRGGRIEIYWDIPELEESKSLSEYPNIIWDDSNPKYNPWGPYLDSIGLSEHSLLKLKPWVVYTWEIPQNGK